MASPAGAATVLNQVAGLFHDVGNGLKYAAEQCTAYVADLFGWVPAGWGAAGNWYAAAQAQGYATSSTPVPGAIAVWAPSKGGAAPDGHVAAVTAVQPNGLPVVQEANWSYGTVNGVGRSDTRLVTPASAQGIVGYILPPKGASVSSTAASTAPPYLPITDPGTFAAAWASGADPLHIIGSELASLPADIIAGLVTALGAALTAMGHAIANTIGVTATDLGRVVQNHLVPVAVAAVVTATLFA